MGIVMVMVGVGVLVICRMKQKLDVTASDPNYVRGGGAAFGNPAYAPAGGAIDEANEGDLDIQEEEGWPRATRISVLSQAYLVHSASMTATPARRCVDHHFLRCFRFLFVCSMWGWI